MRLLVDTSVWADFLRPGDTPQTTLLKNSIRRRDELCTAAPIVAEVLSGIQEGMPFAWVRRLLLGLTVLDVDRRTLEWMVYHQGLARALSLTAGTNDWIVVALSQRYRVRVLFRDPVLLTIREKIGFPCVDG